MDISQYKTSAQVALMLKPKRSQDAVSKMCQRGVFPGAVKIGKTWLIPVNEIDLGRHLKPGAKPKSSS